jgi:hypothetical protein
MIMSKIDSSYNYEVVRAFMQTFEPYPIGTRVVLTGELSGSVHAHNPGYPCRPVIQLEQYNTLVDLTKLITFKIENVISTS